MTARCPNRQRRHTPSSWTTPNPDTTLLGLYFQQPARPVTGVVATAWNAGIWGAGAGADWGEGAGAETRADGVERAGLAVGAARRTGAGRGAETVTSGSVSVTWPQATSGNINAPIAKVWDRRERRP